jgi:hypothetical protein
MLGLIGVVNFGEQQVSTGFFGIAIDGESLTALRMDDFDELPVLGESWDSEREKQCERDAEHG